MRVTSAAAVLAAVLAAGCESIRPSVPEPPAAATATPVDTILPAEEALRRFRATIAVPPTGLRGGEPGIEALVERWVEAVASHDTATVRRLLLDRSEFAYLYYPTSPFARPPYYQPPDLVWFQFQANGEKGIVRVLRRLGGSDLRYLGVACPAEPRPQGENRVWEYCAVRRIEGQDTVSQILFGGILERAGSFKFISYSNQL